MRSNRCIRGAGLLLLAFAPLLAAGCAALIGPIASAAHAVARARTTLRPEPVARPTAQPRRRLPQRPLHLAGAREARRRGFSYVNGQDWIEGDRDDPSRGNAHLVVSEDLIHYTELGNAYIAGRFVEQLRRLRLEERIQVVAGKRHDSAASARSLAATNP